MTRAAVIPYRKAPSYFEHADKLHAAGAVVYGPHLDVDHDSLESIRDPFRMARRFAYALALETGEPFSWGWYESPQGLRPAVCATELAWKHMRVNGSTGRA